MGPWVFARQVGYFGAVECLGTQLISLLLFISSVMAKSFEMALLTVNHHFSCIAEVA